VSARITGGRPHTDYTLIGFDCAGTTGYQPWATGVTDVAGTGRLSGHARTVSQCPFLTAMIRAQPAHSPGR
jgi:hypothetical protein